MKKERTEKKGFNTELGVLNNNAKLHILPDLPVQQKKSGCFYI